MSARAATRPHPLTYRDRPVVGNDRRDQAAAARAPPPRAAPAARAPPAPAPDSASRISRSSLSSRAPRDRQPPRTIPSSSPRDPATAPAPPRARPHRSRDANHPLRPGATSSTKPPTGVASTGRFRCSASSAAYGQHSHNDGITTTSCSRIASATPARSIRLPQLASAHHPRSPAPAAHASTPPAAPCSCPRPPTSDGNHRAPIPVTARTRFCTPLRRSSRPAYSNRSGPSAAETASSAGSTCAGPAIRVADAHRGGQRARAVEPPIGAEHVASLPDHPVRVRQRRTAPSRATRTRRKVALVVAVEQLADLGCRCASARTRACPPRNGSSASAACSVTNPSPRIVGELDQVRARRPDTAPAAARSTRAP